jgi:uncharacterized RDD family membrane protein YckC
MNKPLASYLIRFAAFLIDIPAVLTIHFTLMYLSTIIYPPSQVEFRVMMEMTETSQWWFLAKSIFFVVFIFLYHSILPITILGGTFGQLICGVRLVKSDGSNPGWRQILGRSLSIALQWCVVLFPGPVLSKFGLYDTAFTTMLLLLAIIFLIVTSFVSIGDTPRVNLWDRLGSYRFISIRLLKSKNKLDL